MNNMLESSIVDSLKAALQTWNRPDVSKDAQEAEVLRAEFIARFPLTSWPNMSVDSYALGLSTEGGTVCWWLEFKTRPVASMSGGSSSKHLVFKGSGGDWRYPKQYSSVDEAWSAVRAGFVQLFDLAAQGNFDEADSITALVGAAALRTKALYMYFPDDLVPVCSKVHLHHFLRTLGEDPSDLPTIRANRRLLAALRAIPELAAMSTQELGFFLYHWADPRSTVRVVKIAPGERASEWSDCLASNYVCVGWDDVGDLSQFPTKEVFRDAFREKYPYNGHESQVSRKSNELWTLMELEPGDKVIANRGVSEVLAVGTVNDVGYVWRPERQQYRHTLGVDWDKSFACTIEPARGWATTTVSKVPAALFKAITGGAGSKTPIDVPRVYLDIEEALERRGQVVVYGPPGTGKTYTARRASVWLLEGGSAEPSAADVLEDDDRFEVRERQLSAGRAQSNQLWFMVANPSHWLWSNLFSDTTVDYSLGRLKRNYPNVRAGDLVIGYESTPTKRVVALARVTSEYDPDAPPESALTLEPVARVNDGITYEELQADPILSMSEPARFRCQGTLFALTAVEGDRLLSLLAERDPSLTTVAAPSVQQLTRVTFHPSYTYEDFVEGFRPAQTGSGALELTLTDGIFKRVCEAAAADKDRRYVVLIDEINRGNIPKIFGELITLIESDKRGLTVRLPQSGQEFAVPSNMHLIGTMNTADRSIHLLDTALRRRFSFVELLPDSDLLEGATAGVLALDVFLDALNAKIRELVGREKQVGHAMFLRKGIPIDSAEAFAAIFRFELLPLLQEYLYEDYKELEWLLGGVIDAGSERVSQLADDPETLCAELANHLGANATA
jgi:5-methylcytosine-specific restriction protein B